MSEDPRLANVVAFVEATTFEENCIWANFTEKYNRVQKSEWVQGTGLFKNVGYIQKRPINITLSFSTIKGKVVCFYDAVSPLADHEMIGKWIRQQSAQKNVVYTDAQNFHIALQRVEELDKTVVG